MSHQNFIAAIREPTKIITASPVIRAIPIIPPTGVVPGTYSNPTIEIDATGRIIGAENGSDSTREFIFANQLTIIAEHNFGRRAIAVVLNEQGDRLYCAEKHTLNRVTIEFNYPQSGVIICG